MKTRRLVSILILVLVVLIVTGSGKTKQKTISEEDFFEAWSGTWINTDYKVSDAYPKIVVYADGTVELYGSVTGTKPGHKHRNVILDHWIDTEGIIWYKAQSECLFSGDKSYELGKISDSGNALEYIFSVVDSPIEEWEPDKVEYNYRIYYRQ